MSTPDTTEPEQLDEVLAAYLEGVEAGWAVPDLARLQACYPHLADDLARFFADQQRVERAARPLRPDPLPQVAASPGTISDRTVTTPPDSSWPDITGYEILEELSRGGMGVVYRARHLASQRTVALKMIVSGAISSPQDRERFRAEVQAVARLQHPGIVSLYEVGETPAGPYFTMEYLEGGSLARRLDGTPLPPPEAARLVQQLAEAIHAAHQQGIIHRDLKPANVLLQRTSRKDAKAQRDSEESKPDSAATSPLPLGAFASLREMFPKIADFGLARRLDVSGHTVSGAIVGTPSYMAPEQAESKRHAIGPATDVYALGAILYELLTGRPPFKAANPLDTIMQVIRDEPVSPRRLQPRTPPDLEQICLKCLEKDPGKRYASALELADDLGRFQRGEPVRARSLGRLARGWRWCKRNPAVAALLALVAVVLLAGVSVASYLIAEVAGRAEAETNAQRAREQEERANRLAVDEFKARTEADQQRQRAEEQLNRARRHLFTAQLLRVEAIWERDPNQARDLLHDYNACPIDLRDFTWRLYDSAYQHKRKTLEPATLRGHWAEVTSVAFSRDGQTLASGSRDKTIKLWDVKTSKLRASLKGHTDWVYSVAFSRDGQTLASGSCDRTIKLWDVQTGQLRASLQGHTDEVTSVAFSSDGQTLASGSHDKTIKLWDVKTAKERASLQGHKSGVYSVAFSPDGPTLASGSWGVIKLWDVQTGQLRASLQGHPEMVQSVAFSRDGQTLASGGYDHFIKLWDVKTGKERAALKVHKHWVTSVAVNPDGQTLASGSLDGIIRLWDVQTGQLRTFLTGHSEWVTSVAFSSDGQTLASGSYDKTIKLWDVQTGQERASLKGGWSSVAFSPDGQTLASGGKELEEWNPNEINLWDVKTGQLRASLQGHTDVVKSVAFSSDGQTLASGSYDKTIKLWDVQTGQQRASLQGHAGKVTSVAFGPYGQTLASGSADKTIKLWDIKTGKERASLQGHTAWVYSVAFSRDGQTLASGSADGTIKLWDIKTGKERASLKGHTGDVNSVAFRNDGQTLAAGVGDRTIKLWDIKTGKERASLKGHTGPVTSVAFSRDGQTLASGSGDSTIKLWDVQTGQERASLQGHKGGVDSVAFSPDGQTLASGSDDQTVKLWNVKTGP
jgi:WD40 repeat protein/serine/threonine protein kinase